MHEFFLLCILQWYRNHLISEKSIFSCHLLKLTFYPRDLCSCFNQITFSFKGLLIFKLTCIFVYCIICLYKAENTFHASKGSVLSIIVFQCLANKHLFNEWRKIHLYSNDVAFSKHCMWAVLSPLPVLLITIIRILHLGCLNTMLPF